MTSTDPTPPRIRRGPLNVVRGVLLNVAAAGGAICIVMVILAFGFHITLIMFRTGSMSPAIPTGSLAVVKQIPAAQAQVGQVVTVDRPGQLPITHRVVTTNPRNDGSATLRLAPGQRSASPPGVPAHWVIGITTQPISTTTLLSRVTATGALADASPTALVISLASCTAPWQGASCRATEHQILTTTPLPVLADATDSGSVVDTSTIPARTYLLASVLQPSRSPVTTSQSAEITITISATGDDPPATEHPANTALAPPPDSQLAYTGTRIGLATLLAAASVTLGVSLAASARRAHRREQP